jgi:hypothetical protein
MERWVAHLEGFTAEILGLLDVLGPPLGLLLLPGPSTLSLARRFLLWFHELGGVSNETILNDTLLQSFLLLASAHLAACLVVHLLALAIARQSVCRWLTLLFFRKSKHRFTRGRSHVEEQKVEE